MALTSENDIRIDLIYVFLVYVYYLILSVFLKNFQIFVKTCNYNFYNVI